MKAKASGATRELASPPGRVVVWIFKVNGEEREGAGKTAFEAAAKLGLLLSQCSDVSWAITQSVRDDAKGR